MLTANSTIHSMCLNGAYPMRCFLCRVHRSLLALRDSGHTPALCSGRFQQRNHQRKAQRYKKCGTKLFPHDSYKKQSLTCSASARNTCGRDSNFSMLFCTHLQRIMEMPFVLIKGLQRNVISKEANLQIRNPQIMRVDCKLLSFKATDLWGSWSGVKN